jgi:hypothetical protein
LLEDGPDGPDAAGFGAIWKGMDGERKMSVM